MKVLKIVLLVAVFSFLGYWAVKIIYYLIMAMSLGMLWVLI